MTPSPGGPHGAPGRPPSAGPGAPGRQGVGHVPPDDEVAEGEVVDEVSDAETFVGQEIGGMLDTLQRERDEYLDMVRRVQADFENYKKRVLRQQTDHLERAAEDLVTKVLPVLDAFDLARAHLGGGELTDEGKALSAGSTLLADTLAREGLERIDDPGAPFDPTTHEAVEHVPADEGPPAGAGAPGTDPPAGPVVDGVLRAGYRWKGRVIRPAMVRVRG